MFKHYFNMAILYMCLYGKENFIPTDAQKDNGYQVIPLHFTVANDSFKIKLEDYIYLYTSAPGITTSNPRALTCYFYGVTKFANRTGYGAGNILRRSRGTINEIKGYCSSFIEMYSPKDGFKSKLITALYKDGYNDQFIRNILIKIENKDNSWFYTLYYEAINKEAGYFESDTDRTDVTVLDRFDEIEKSCEKVYSELVDEYNKPKEKEDKALPASGADDNTDIHQLAVDWFNTQSSTGRYRGYGKSKGKRQIKEIKNKLDTADSEPRYLIDIIFDESDNTHSINLCGKGGSGKTFQILRSIDTILNDKPTILPFYIPLSSLEFSDSKSNCIVEYLANEVGFLSIDQTKKTLKKKGTSIILFADGLNEISDPAIRRKIAIDICQLRQKYKTRFLVSSRQDHTDLFNTLNYGEDKYFIKAEVLDLSEEQINEYFLKVKCSVMYEDVPVPTRKLLHTPQGCVMYAELIGSDLENTIKIQSLGELLECYCNSILGVDSHSQSNQYEKPLMEIGYHMVLNGWFNISEEEIEELENISSEDKRILLSDKSPTWSIFIKNNNGDFEFTHQNYRDLFCAKKFASLIKKISSKTLSHDLESIFVTNNVTMNDEILELTSAFIGNGRTSIQSIIDIVRENVDNLTGKYADNYDFPLSVLIRIYAFSHNNNISDLNLSDLDLTEVCLNGYELYDRESEKGTELFGATINFNTVLKVGFPTGSSAICTFVNNDKTYIAAFDRTTAMIIDIEENQRQLVRNLSDYGWVNIAYPTEMNGEVCILLGCDSGKVVVFYPNRLENIPKLLLFDTNVKSEDGIQSIIQVKKDNIEYWLFTNTDGWVFVYDCSNNILLDPISVCDNEQERLGVIDAWNKYDSKMIIACRMDYDKANNQVLISFGNKVYRMDLASDGFKVTEYNIEWNYQTPRLIKDIKVTQSYIFINEIDAISVIRNGIKTWEFVINQDKRLADRELFLRNVFKLDEAMIQEVIAAEKSISTAYGKKIKNFYFQKFSTIPDGLYKKEEGVLVGIKTPNESLYKQLPQFIEIKVRSSCKSIVKHNNITPIHTNQTLATQTGVYYKLKSMPDTILLATTSDDRSIDLIAPHAEEFVPQHIEGAYNGVRDIEFIDDTHFVCAQYDGSLILFSLIKKNNKKSSWRLTNVIKSHHGWVWKAGLYDEWSDENQRVVSCSYDGTVRITDFSNSETSVPIIKASQPIRGVYRKGSDIWAFSPQSMYHARFAEDKWISDDAYDENDFGISQLNISLIADLDNDVPFVFYNTGKGTQGYIAAFENHSKLINKITCEEGVFLRKIKQYFYKENDYMVVVGSKDKMAYVALYQRADSNYLPEPVSSCSMSSSTPNDFTIVNSKWGDYIIIVNSNNSITTCRINADLSLTEDKLLTNLTGQPLCITSNGDLILVGLLNGKILQVVMTDNSENSFNFSYKDFAFTHANLYSTPNVDLSECEIQDEESFKAQLKDYFSFD